MTALTDEDNVLFEEVTDDGEGLTEEEAYAFLLGESIFVASANPVAHTGAMIALVPSQEDIDRYAVIGGEDPTELHLTFLYLGEAADIPEDKREEIIEIGRRYMVDKVKTEAFYATAFNPHNPDMETALVLGIKGEELVGPRSNIVSAVRGIYNFPPNHEPWLPHVTLEYVNDVSRATKHVEKLGPVTFDTLRFAFGDEVYDFPLLDPPNELEPLTAASTKLPKQLLKYWLGPAGSARVGGWGNPGSFTACQREMRREGVPARMVDGLCANLYERATGKHPGRAKEGAMTASVEIADIEFEDDVLELEEAPVHETKAAWEGVITVEGHESGDGRMFQLGSLDWDNPPIPLMYQPANIGGHNGSVLVGQITNIARTADQIYAWGIIDLDAVYNGFEIGKEVYRLMSEEYLNGVSVDVDKVKNADVELVYAADDPLKPTLTVFKRGRIRGATLVAFPAFVEAQIYLTGEVMTAAAAGVDENCGCDAPLVAASHTIEIPDLPPAEWFNEPTDVELKGALTVTDEGRVYGLLAPANTTHRAVKSKVPLKNVDYSRFMGKETLVAGGGRVVTGPITMNCGHAPTQNYGTLEDRIEHYDNACSVVANVRIGETEDGAVWVAGALTPFATADQVARMMSCTLSGDWQPHPDRKGVREFIAALLVPVPGFAMARSAASVSYTDGVVTASSVPVVYATEVELEGTNVDEEAGQEIAEADDSALVAAALDMKRSLAEWIGRDPSAIKAQLAKEIGR